ncbi:MAG: hypothetical protein KDI68_05810 [Gammaproteobacteria bacterium]|nr:hypothetical protein [Gammaproteobacteria bacterium]
MRPGYLKLKRSYGLWTAEVDPRSIVYRRRKNEWPGYVKRWPLLVCPGGWDLSDNDYEPFRLAQMRELFEEQLPYRETAFYRRMCAELASDGITHAPKLHSLEQVNAYFERLESLYTSMRDNGFQARGPAQAQTEREITVRIARDGDLIKSGEGTHRLALARLLEIARVPVVIDLVHPRWVERCILRYDSDPAQAVRLALTDLSSPQA